MDGMTADGIAQYAMRVLETAVTAGGLILTASTILLVIAADVYKRERKPNGVVAYEMESVAAERLRRKLHLIARAGHRLVIFFITIAAVSYLTQFIDEVPYTSTSIPNCSIASIYDNGDVMLRARCVLGWTQDSLKFAVGYVAAFRVALAYALYGAVAGVLIASARIALEYVEARREAQPGRLPAAL
jgi:hypothetical protein